MDKKRFAHIAKWVFLTTFVVALFLPAFSSVPWWFVITIEANLTLSIIGAVACFFWKGEKVSDIPDIYILWTVISTMSSGVVCISTSGIMRLLAIVITVIMAIVSVAGLMLRTRRRKARDISDSEFLSFLFGVLWVYMIPFIGVVGTGTCGNLFAIAWGSLFGLWWVETFFLYFLSGLPEDSF